MTRAANMQALTNDVRREYPGVVVYGIGDTAHKARASGHNEDDTAGSKPELNDADSRPEHRAIDIMVGPRFTKADADALVARLVADPKARARLYYVIWHGYQWSRSSGWVGKKYTGSDQHRDHVHISGWAADDENTATWPAVAKKEQSAMAMSDAEKVAWSTTNRAAALLAGTPASYQLEGEKTRRVEPNRVAESLTRIEMQLTALSGRDFTDEPAIVRGVLAALTPQAIAAAIPAALTEQVADELAKRLQG